MINRQINSLSFTDLECESIFSGGVKLLQQDDPAVSQTSLPSTHSLYLSLSPYFLARAGYDLDESSK